MSLTFRFDNLQAFFWMDGHGPYVWGCYGIMFVLMVTMALEPIWKRKKFIRQQQGILRRKAQAHSSEV